METYLWAGLFAFVPAFIVGLLIWGLCLAPWIGLISGLGVFGLGLDVLLRGSPCLTPSEK